MTPATIISIGDEILQGKIVNTNATFLAKKLVQLNCKVISIIVCADSKDKICNELDQAWQKSQIVIVTGGLGPTHDDLTSESVAHFFQTKLSLHQPSLDNVHHRFAVMKKTMAPGNEKVAYIPDNSKAINNPEGTAPGYCIEQDNKIMVVLPGVPHESRTMFEQTIVPMISQKYFRDTSLQRLRIRTAGIGESMIFHRMDHMKWLTEDISVSFLPMIGGVDIDISGQGQNFEDTTNRFRQNLTKYIYYHYNLNDSQAEQTNTLQHAVASLLIQKKKTLALAESCTGGYIANSFTDLPGSSEYFLGSITAYSNEIKKNLLNVSTGSLERFGAVSEQCVKEMASGIRQITGSDIALATTGIAGPTGDTPWKPLGLVYIGYCDQNTCLTQKHIIANKREIHKQRTARYALIWLWQKLKSSSRLS